MVNTIFRLFPSNQFVILYLYYHVNQTVYCITYYISKKTDCHISVVRPAPISSGESEKNSWLTAAAAIYS